jgi:squalene-hopene/tetraprenyl-beta-curcumene cyclase
MYGAAVKLFCCFLFAGIPLLASPAGPAAGEPQSVATPRLSPANLSLKQETREALRKGAAWLVKNQDPKGFWSGADHPAVTALAMVALQGAQMSGGDFTEAMSQARGFVLGCAQPDGSFHGPRGELVNYNTAVSVMGLLAAGRGEDHPILVKARQYLVASQVDLGEPGETDSVFDGGIGYGSKYKHSDMGNTLLALEALYYTRNLAADASSGVKDLNWEAVLRFIQNCQNLPSHNAQQWASDDLQNKGGFVYYPGHSMAGEMTLPSGRVALRSYGSISYGGLLSYAYANLQRDDPRVRAVLDWLEGNYTLEENPGMGQQGLFFYFQTMAKALSTQGIDFLEADGKRINWREELGLKLLNLQQTDGSWANENNRWWEKDPALATSYAMIALALVERGL